MPEETIELVCIAPARVEGKSVTPENHGVKSYPFGPGLIGETLLSSGRFRKAIDSDKKGGAKTKTATRKD